jgi:hypothetical protein
MPKLVQLYDDIDIGLAAIDSTSKFYHELHIDNR